MNLSYKNQSISFEPTTALSGNELIKGYIAADEKEILCMACDNEIQSLNNMVSPDTKNCIFYDISHPLGAECLAVSTTALMLMSAEELFPETRISVEHSFGKGFYCEPLDTNIIPPGYLELIKSKMHEFVQSDFQFKERKLLPSDIKELGYNRFRVLENSPKQNLRIYELQNFPHWFISALVPSASYINKFKLTPYKRGFVLNFPTQDSPNEIPSFKPSPNLFSIIRESEERGEMLEIKTVNDLNKRGGTPKEAEAIQLYEALHEKKIAEIADVIAHRKKLRFVFIAGPSASGKTTFMKRLSLQLRINGLKPKHLSLDNYFVERHQTPLDQKGELDFEHFEAIDHELLNDHLTKLMNGQGVHLPKFQFTEGKKLYDEKETTLREDEILILEGIHGLNPNLAKPIPEQTKFRIYISALTQLNYNLYNRVSTSDTRLLRRMYRDLQFRGHSPEQTLKRWPSVRRGENKWIFPFQENADIYFNSALEYEWPVFSGILLKELRAIHNNSPIKVEAERLSCLMELFIPFSTKYIPPTSLVQEFLGGSSFVY